MEPHCAAADGRLDRRSLKLSLGGGVTGAWYRRGRAGTAKPRTDVQFGLSPLGDELATEFLGEVTRRSGLQITYGVMPGELRNG